MKIPSVFKKPKYQRFNITPRYYDPVKEEIEQRTSRIKERMRMDEGTTTEGSHMHSRISGAFKPKRARVVSAAGLMQMVIIILLVSVMVGYLYFGNIALYIFLIVSSVLLYLKVKRIL